ncbi:MAG TPA: M18 family aminopeptidase [Pseudomonadales bacterium]
MSNAMTDFNEGLLAFLDASPTPFHATAEMLSMLADAGFTVLDEAADWRIQPGGRYAVVRGGSSIIAFNWPEAAPRGLRIVGAHTDSPCLKIKPRPDVVRHGCWQLGVEVYGGVLLNTWFDRDLSLAGRVTYLDDLGRLCNALVDLREPIATVPSLAIHLDREANDKRSINQQDHLPLVLGQDINNPDDFRAYLLAHLKGDGVAAEQVLDFDVFAYDTQPATITGVNGEFIRSARLDNLLSCYTGLQALMQADPADGLQLLVCNDHEEVGSTSVTGADGNFLESVLMRLFPDAAERAQQMAQSLMISTDNAHAIHPNYAEKHEPQHAPRINRGPVIKFNARQRYATAADVAAYFRWLCGEVSVPVQDFVVRTDMGCGSTIGPMTSARLGVRTLDVGVPTLGMHSIRELAGTADALSLTTVLGALYAFRGELPA